MTTHKRDFLFKFVATSLREKLLMDDEALYSTTDQQTADKITKEIAQILPKSAKITDATACIGGSANALASYFNNVCAIELDPQKYAYLTANLATLGRNNVKCICGDALIVCSQQQQDMIFIDCPWNGPSYKEVPSLMLYLSGIPLYDVVRTLINHTKYIAIKAPVNFDEATFLEKTKDILKIQQKLRLRKMLLFILSNNIKIDVKLESELASASVPDPILLVMELEKREH
jgi:16S rRNA G966 N2-methylase RsmD